MNWLDIILGLLLLSGIVSGYKNGIIGEVATLAALILGIWGAVKFSWWTADMLLDLGVKSDYMHIISFIVTFILIVVAIQLLAKFLSKLLETMALGFVNRLAGMVVGIIKAALIVSVILVVINALDEENKIIKETIQEESLFYDPLSNLVPSLLPFIHLEDLQIDKKRI